MTPANFDHWVRLDSGPGAPAYSMAVDEALLEAAPALGQPVLRFYGWTESAATFGYFQKISEIERVTRLRPLVRRPTGGGLVPHDADWTYSLALPPAHAWHALRATESYERVHQWLRAAFARLGVAAELAPCCRKEIPGQCFAGHEKSDLLWHGRKIAGAAQRRTKTGLLIQGSVQPRPARTGVTGSRRWATRRKRTGARTGNRGKFPARWPDASANWWKQNMPARITTGGGER